MSTNAADNQVPNRRGAGLIGDGRMDLAIQPDFQPGADIASVIALDPIIAEGEVSEQFRKVLDELLSAVAEQNEEVFTAYMDVANRRLAETEEKTIGS